MTSQCKFFFKLKQLRLTFSLGLGLSLVSETRGMLNPGLIYYNLKCVLSDLIAILINAALNEFQGSACHYTKPSACFNWKDSFTGYENNLIPLIDKFCFRS